MRRLGFLVPLLACSLAPFGCDRTNPDDYPAPPVDECPLVAPEDYTTAVKCDAYKSCVFQCGAPCAEPERPYECPSLRPWAAIPHAATCGAFDGTTFPAPAAGKCTGTTPTGDAAQYAGKDTVVAGRFHIGDGHFVQPAGHDQILHGKGITSAFLADLMLIPGTSFAVVTDAGVSDNAIYVVDLDKLAADQPALVSTTAFPRPSQLDYGLAFVAPDHVYVSGAGNGVVFGFTINTTTGALTADKASDLDMGKSGDSSARSQWYVGGLAPTKDGTKLVVAPSTGEKQVRIVDRTTKAITAIDVSPSAVFFGIFHRSERRLRQHGVAHQLRHAAAPPRRSRDGQGDLEDRGREEPRGRRVPRLHAARRREQRRRHHRRRGHGRREGRTDRKPSTELRDLDNYQRNPARYQ